MNGGRDIDIIKLNGSIEIAPILGLSDDRGYCGDGENPEGKRELEVIDTIVPISARLIANKTNFKFKTEAVEKIRNRLAEQLEVEK